jgi:uncharacterized protein with ATP-grasp and redox domains
LPARQATKPPGATPHTQLRSGLRQALVPGCADWHLSPALAQPIHRLIREVTHNRDPYAAVKEQLNQRAEQLYPTWRQRFREKFSPLEAAVAASCKPERVTMQFAL